MKVMFDTLGKLLTDFPELKYIDEAGKKEISGKVKLFANFDEEKNSYQIYPPFSEGCSLKGLFSVYVDFSSPNPYREVYETSGKIFMLSKQNKISLAALHTRRTDCGEKICIAGYFEEQYNVEIYDFFLKYVLQFFCDILYYKKFGIFFPRGEHRHYEEGLLYDFLHLEYSKENVKKLIEELKLMNQKKYSEVYRPLLIGKYSLDNYKKRLSLVEFKAIFLAKYLINVYNIKF